MSGKKYFIFFYFICFYSFLNAQNVIDPNFTPDINHKKERLRVLKNDSILKNASNGVLQFEKIKIKNRIDGLSIPVYVFKPLLINPGEKHPALVWVYGGVHDNFSTNYFPFIKEALAQGYVVIAPEYRGAKGYGKDFYDAIDYGGLEVEDVISAGEYLKAQDYIDTDNIGVIGWSHGGLISLLSVFRDQNLFSCGVATVPVTNLIFRLSYKGPDYQKLFVSQKGIGGLPHEKRALYLKRSPLYQVDHLQVPLMVQLATNDTDVDFVEAEMLVNALKVKKANLAEVIVYDNPKHGHYLNRQVDLKTLTRKDDVVQIDSWDKIWTFLNIHLK